ncbi:type-1 restriction enzyme EcoKI specificity protein [Microcystis aeruginosa Sj]|uniref:Type-1 restriction enzyme EcoKI specificity protein n=1 Tax=Microcystis aeruginosa Sj TaxID=1979544 RepID=A0A2Z6UJU6_MICAE|nr:restriction endonuclease subunit S [Microcystis aeruginosa]GBL08796.1 type-1 restriction enzyme EcoKI specificity protein [Microcystis aeruginosa Sj]
MKVKSEYPVITLGKLAEKIDYGFSASATDVGDGPKFLRITDIQDDHVNWLTVPLCEADKQDTIKYALAEGDIVFARTGATTGKSYLIRHCPQNSIFASYLIRVRPSKDVDSGYLSRFFQTSSYWRQINLNTSGTAQGGVNATKLKTLLVPLPPLEEQRRIAAILDKADGVRRKRKEAIRLTEELLKSTFLEMFGDPVTNPKGWETHKLKEFTKRPITYGILKPGPHVSEGIPMLRIQDIHNGRVTASGIHKVSPELSSEYSRTVLRGGEIVISLVGTLGLTALIPESLKGANVHRNLGVIDIESEIVLSSFIFHYFKFSGIENFLLKNTKGGVQSLLNLGELREMPVNLPPLSLQQDFESLASNQIALNTNALSAYEQSENLFNSLLQRAFRGEL